MVAAVSTGTATTTTPRLGKDARHSSPSPLRRHSDKPSNSRNLSTPRFSPSPSNPSNPPSTSNSTRRFTSPLPTRSNSVDRVRPISTIATTPTTTRSLSVSFQGESFFYQTSKSRDPRDPKPSPSPTRRSSPAPKRQQTPNAAAASAPARPGAHYPWPSAKTHQLNPLTKSLDCSLTKRAPPALAAAVKSLRRSMLFGDGVPRRNSFDCAELSFSSDTDSTSSGSVDASTTPRTRGTPRGASIPAKYLQETHDNSRIKKVLEPGSNNLLKKKLINPSPLNSQARLAASPAKRTASPSRVRNGNTGVSLSNSSKSNTEGRRKKSGEQEHVLRVLHNRYLQWWCINTRIDAALSTQKINAEKYLYYVWITMARKCDSVMLKRLKVQALAHHLKLTTVLKSQMGYLEEWSLLDRDYFDYLSGFIDALKTITLSLPLTDGAKADIQEVKNSVGSAVDAMQTIERSICNLNSKVIEASSLVSELAKIALKEKDLMQHSRELLSTVATLHVKYCSLQGQRVQLKN